MKPGSRAEGWFLAVAMALLALAALSVWAVTYRPH